jgi:uncharacterized protein (DUF1778 family)
VPSSTRRKERLILRRTSSAKHALQAAAAEAHCSLSEFVLTSALGRANEVLADRRIFSLSAGKWKAFMAALDAPVRPHPCLARLLTEPGFLDAGQ